MQLILLLTHIMEERETEETDKFILLGDFNAIPGMLTASLLKNEPPEISQIEVFKKDKNLGNSILKKALKIYDSFDQQGLIDLDIISAYKKFKVFKREIDEDEYNEALSHGEDDIGFPDMTNFTETFRETLDHLLFNNDGFELYGLLDVPCLKQCGKHQGFPCEDFPSDHLPIGAVFGLSGH